MKVKSCLKCCPKQDPFKHSSTFFLVVFTIIEQIQNFTLGQCSLGFTHLCYAVWADFGHTGAEVEAGFNPFLPLTPVTEPDSDHLLLQMKTFGYTGYFLGGRLTFLHEAALQGLLSSQTAARTERRRDT